MNSGTGTDTGTGLAAGRVLVVDDEKPLARMVATYLGRAGYEVALTNARDSAVTVSVYEQRAGEWSVIASSVPPAKQ